MPMHLYVHLPRPGVSSAVTTVTAELVRDTDDFYGVLGLETSTSDGISMSIYIDSPQQADILLEAVLHLTRNMDKEHAYLFGVDQDQTSGDDAQYRWEYDPESNTVHAQRLET